MIEKITLDMLSEYGVDVKFQKYSTVDNIEYPVGQPFRKAYSNSALGRQQIENEIQEPYKSVIFMIWGDEPTVFPKEA